jgi:hypothetical protein
MHFAVLVPKAVCDQRPHPLQGPELGRKACRQRTALEQARQFAPLRDIEAAGSTQGAGLECLCALGIELLRPGIDRLAADADPARHLGLGHTLLQQACGPQPSTLQCFQIAFHVSLRWSFSHNSYDKQNEK